MMLVFGVLLISGALTYAWWIRVRVVCLRQDIYDLRDELFDIALKLRALDDPGYKATRAHLNGLARSAEVISVPLAIYASTLETEAAAHRGHSFRSADPALQSSIDDVHDRCARRLVRFLFWETLSGLVGRIFFAMTRNLRLAAERMSITVMERWIESAYPEQLVRAKGRQKRSRNRTASPFRQPGPTTSI